MKTPPNSHSVPGADPHRISVRFPTHQRKSDDFGVLIVALYLLIKLDRFGC